MSRRRCRGTQFAGPSAPVKSCRELQFRPDSWPARPGLRWPTDSIIDSHGTPIFISKLEADPLACPACIQAADALPDSSCESDQEVRLCDPPLLALFRSLIPISLSLQSKLLHRPLEQTKKWGTLVQLCVVRSAMRRAIELIVSRVPEAARPLPNQVTPRVPGCLRREFLPRCLCRAPG